MGRRRPTSSRSIGAGAGAGAAQDATFQDYGSLPTVRRELTTHDLDAVLSADAVLLVPSEDNGRGMFVERGAHLARCRRGSLEHVLVARFGTSASSITTAP